MLANTNSISSAPANRSVREFIAVFARHNVAYGEPNCLRTLLRELHLNKHLAMHFWAVVASQTDKQAATPDLVAASIVEASTGQTPMDLCTAGPGYSALVDRLERLLAGQDIAPDELPGLRDAAPAPTAPERQEPAPVRSAEDVLPIRRPRDTNGPRRLPHTIAEIGAASGSGASESRRLVILPESHRVEESTQVSRPGARHSAAPLAGYAKVSPRSRMEVPALIALGVILFAGTATVVHRDADAMNRLGSSVAAGYQSAIAAWRGQSNAVAAPIINGPLAPPESSPARPPVNASTAKPAAVAPARHARSVAQNAAAASIDPGPRPDPDALTPAQKMAAVAAYNEQRDVAQSSPAADAPVVSVPESAMNAHLLVSRVPVVPEPLRATGASGLVRLQADINREGTVSHLQVLEGPTDLRRPALEAVAAWRYRPYLVNGQPVDVSTTITVDFSSLN